MSGFQVDFMDRLLFVLAILISATCYGQKESVLLSAWKSYPIPTDQATLHEYNWSKNEWTVFIKDNQIFVINDGEKISDTLPFKIIPKDDNERYILEGRRSVIKVDDGYLVGFYRGEWGGNLFWFSNDGKKKYEISSHEIVQFVVRDNKIYAIEGLAHLLMSEGSIIQIQKKNGRWTTSEYVKLPSALDAIAIDEHNNFIIITSHILLAIDATAKTRTLVEKGFWLGLYPTSLIIQNGSAYIGMRKGVLKYNLKTREQVWMMPD